MDEVGKIVASLEELAGNDDEIEGIKVVNNKTDVSPNSSADTIPAGSTTKSSN